MSSQGLYFSRQVPADYSAKRGNVKKAGSSLHDSQEHVFEESLTGSHRVKYHQDSSNKN